MRVWGVLVAAGYRRFASYRAAMLGGALTNAVFGLLRASIVSGAVVSAGGAIAGYDAASAVTYAFVTQAVIAPVNVFTWDSLALRVRSGDIALDLARPVDLQLQYAAEDLGRAAAQILPRAMPPLLVGALTFGLAVPTDPLVVATGLLCVVIGVGISFACRFLVNLTSFWLVEIRGLITLYTSVSAFLCGLFVPVAWFPGWLHTIALATPFPWMVQAPSDVLTGRVDGAGLLAVLAVQLGWLAAVVLAGRVVLARASRRLVVQGG